MDNRIIDVISHFPTNADILNIEKNESGHINSTYIITVSGGNKYVLQRINTDIFKNPDELMSNIIGVTDFIREKLTSRGIDAERRTLRFIPSDEGLPYYKDKGGDCWRLYHYIDDVTSYLSTDSEKIFYNCAKAFGEFQQLLSDYPAEKLHETIKNFHNTVSRFEDFKKAVDEDKAGRKAEVEKEIAFICEREKLYSYITDRLENGTYSLRVTHNDTKLSNILIDNETLEGICVIDLDTVMSGSVLYDYGDSIRFGACSSPEDESDISKVHLDFGLFEAYTKGFLEGVDNSLSREEILGLPYGALIITIEIGMRFLADYLNGDTYFAVHRKGQNLDRARTQLALAADMEKNFDKMTEIVKKYGNIR